MQIYVNQCICTKNLQKNLARGGEGGSKAIWIFSGNSSILAVTIVLKLATSVFTALHFCSMASCRNHVDQWCHSNCNPDSVPELAGVNSQVCEQLFKKINSHRNCRKMNEARFGLFFLYQYEIHNLEIEKRTILADPREDVRWDNIKISQVVIETPSLLDEQNVEKGTGGDLEFITTVVKKLTMSEKFVCPECKAEFVKEGNLKQHTSVVHNQSKNTGNACGHCQNLLSSAQALKRHIKSHMKCKVCKKEFDSIAETNTHMKSHTTCNICNYDFKSNIKRHMRDIHGVSSKTSTKSKLAEVN